MQLELLNCFDSFINERVRLLNEKNSEEGQSEQTENKLKKLDQEILKQILKSCNCESGISAEMSEKINKYASIIIDSIHQFTDIFSRSELNIYGGKSSGEIEKYYNIHDVYDATQLQISYNIDLIRKLVKKEKLHEVGLKISFVKLKRPRQETSEKASELLNGKAKDSDKQ